MTFIRYIAIGAATYGLDIGLFLLLIKINIISPIVANIVSKLAAGIFGFIAHRSFTFRIKTEQHKIQHALRYFSLLAINIPLFSAIFAATLIWITDPKTAKVASDIICVILSYLQSRYFVFTKKVNA